MRSEDSFMRELTTSPRDLMAFRAVVLRHAAKVLDAMFGPVYAIDPLSGDRVNLGKWLATVYPSQYTAYDCGEEVGGPLTREEILEFGRVFNEFGRVIPQGEALPMGYILDEMPPVQHPYGAKDAEMTLQAMAKDAEMTRQAIARIRPETASKDAEDPSAGARMPEAHLCPYCGCATHYTVFTGGREWWCPDCKETGAYPPKAGPRAVLLQSEEGRKSLREQMRERLRELRGAKE